MKHLVFLLPLLALVGCATTQPPGAVRTGPPTYPTTRIELPNGLILTHLARYDPDHIFVPVTDPAASPGKSELQLTDPGKSRVLAYSPSMLDDPRFGSEDFRDYRPESDGLDVFVSLSGRTIAVQEDESSVFPYTTLWIFQQTTPEAAWTTFPLDLPRENTRPGSAFLPDGTPQSQSPLDFVQPYLEGLSDTELYLKLKIDDQDRHWRRRLDSFERRKSTGP